MKLGVWFRVLALVGVSSVALAIDENFCTVPANCVDDKLSVKFKANDTSELSNVNVGDIIEAYAAIDVKSNFTTGCPPPANPPPSCTQLQGFSYGVKHDAAVLEIQDATDEGTDPVIVDAEFLNTAVAEQKLGFIQAVVINTNNRGPFDLPLRDNIKIAIAKYKVKASPGTAGTKIQFANDLKPEGSPATPVTITVAGKSKQPKQVANAIVKGGQVQQPCAEADYAFYFGPAANKAEFDVAGADSLKVSMRNKGVALGFSLGIKKAADKLTFESTLGVSGREVELVITKADGTEVNGAGLKGNSAKNAPAAQPISKIDRGAVLAGNTPGDFFGVDLSPPVGGPGATVGYVADVGGSNKTIPAVTDPAGGCGSNEILVVTFGAPPKNLSRGDANGDRKINVTDGVVIAQNIFFAATKPALVFFDCRDMLDVNDDGALNVADPMFLMTYVFLNGPAPPAPFRVCAEDPTAEVPDLGCKLANCSG